MDELKNTPLVALEGAAYAGKTTLLNHLRSHYKDRLITIPEASEFVGGDKNFPDVPFRTMDDAKASTHFFLELEKSRLRLAEELHSQAKLPVILDRTTPVSSLIFYQLLRFSSPKDSEFIEAFYHHAISLFHAELANGHLTIPGYIIYIRPLNEDVFNSRLCRGTKNNVFSNWDSFRFLESKYLKLIQLYYKKNSLILDSENTPESLESQSEKVIEFMNEIKASNLSHIFDNFLNENILPYPIETINEFKKYKSSIDHCRELIKNNNISHEW